MTAELEGRQLRVAELSAYGIGRNQAFKLMSDGALPYVQLTPGGRRTVALKDVLKLLRDRTKTGDFLPGM